MKGTGNLFYLFINNGFDKIVGVQDFEPFSVQLIDIINSICSNK